MNDVASSDPKYRSVELEDHTVNEWAMDPDKADLWGRLERLFSILADAPAEERSTMIERHAHDDPELHSEALSLVEALDGAGRSDTFLAELNATLAGRLMSEGSELAIGSQIGPYRITEELGHGGMGTVYLAERAVGDFEQSVAIKVIRWSGLSVNLRERFLSERQILARLEHPGIARLLGGGITEDDEPYFVMEVVAGKPVTEYCNELDLDWRRRLDLFLEVCDAVKYAHRMLVVHRDLKPSNILINADGRPKLVDFGIATALSDPSGDSSERGDAFGLAATPGYAAPEVLARGTITTGVDVYSLAVVLRDLMSTAPEPSRTIRVDLDAIIRRGTASDPNRRYETVDEMSADLERLLGSQPVTAREVTAAYRVRRFTRRHRGVIAAVVTVVFALTVGLAVSLVQTHKARQQAARAEEIKNFLVESFGAADPANARGENLTAMQILDQGARRIKDELEGQPEVQTELEMVLGSIYRDLGHFPESDSLLSRALAVGLTAYSPDDPRLASAVEELARLRLEQSRLAEADSLFRMSLELRRRIFKNPDPAVSRSLSGLATTLVQLGEFEQAEELHREALEIDRVTAGRDSLAFADELQNLGWVLWRRAEYEEAEQRLTDALNIERRHLGENHYKIATTLSTLAKVKSSLGYHAAAESLHREALALRRRILGERHPDVALSLSDLAIAVERQERYEEAASLYQQAIDIDSSTLGWEHAYTINTLNNFAICNYHMGRLDTAIVLMQRVVDLRARTVGLDHPDELTAENNLAAMLHKVGRDQEARQRLMRIIQVRETQGRAKDIDNGFSLKNLGDAYAGLGMYPEAEDAYTASLEILRSKLPENHSRIGDALDALGSTQISQGKYEEAERALKESVDIRSGTRGAFDPRTEDAKVLLAKALMEQGRTAEAELLRAEADSVTRATNDTELRELLESTR